MKIPNHIASILAIAVVLLAVQSAFAFYNPQLGRWANRDPIGETRDINLYCFVINSPIGQADSFGLALWKCSRDSAFGVGQHVYLWNDKNNKACGRGGGPFTGQGVNKDRDKGPGKDTCFEIPNSAGKEDAVMACCQTPRTHIFIPLLHDCHNWFDKCLGDNGLPNPDIYGRFYGPTDLFRDYQRSIFIGGPMPRGPQ